MHVHACMIDILHACMINLLHACMIDLLYVCMIDLLHACTCMYDRPTTCMYDVIHLFQVSFDNTPYEHACIHTMIKYYKWLFHAEDEEKKEEVCVCARMWFVSVYICYYAPSGYPLRLA